MITAEIHVAHDISKADPTVDMVCQTKYPLVKWIYMYSVHAGILIKLGLCPAVESIHFKQTLKCDLCPFLNIVHSSKLDLLGQPDTLYVWGGLT